MPSTCSPADGSDCGASSGALLGALSASFDEDLTAVAEGSSQAAAEANCRQELLKASAGLDEGIGHGVKRCRASLDAGYNEFSGHASEPPPESSSFLELVDVPGKGKGSRNL
ncbi:unnamed protein product [Polarella glacialis]|uniref:Uncharacterized protein n=1 Tax=Polarella glacialis TaxID=89957 RepID=A0A813EXP4_POLGL|nr:unnamed protein product [Polarella glacialis]